MNGLGAYSKEEPTDHAYGLKVEDKSRRESASFGQSDWLNGDALGCWG